VSLSEFKRQLSAQKEGGKKSWKRLIAVADENGDGEVDLAEFRSLLSAGGRTAAKDCFLLSTDVGQMQRNMRINRMGIPKAAHRKEIRAFGLGFVEASLSVRQPYAELTQARWLLPNGLANCAFPYVLRLARLAHLPEENARLFKLLL